MAKILIVYYTRSGHTEQMAQSVAEGARSVKGAEVTVKKVADASPEDMLAADAIVMGSPVYYGTMAAELKRLLDDSVTYHRQLRGKVGGAFASSGAPHGGNETTVLDILRALLVHGMIVQGDPEGDHYGAVAVGAPDDRSKKSCHRMGRTVAELAARLFD